MDEQIRKIEKELAIEAACERIKAYGVNVSTWGDSGPIFANAGQTKMERQMYDDAVRYLVSEELVVEERSRVTFKTEEDER